LLKKRARAQESGLKNVHTKSGDNKSKLVSTVAIIALINTMSPASVIYLRMNYAFCNFPPRSRSLAVFERLHALHNGKSLSSVSLGYYCLTIIENERWPEVRLDDNANKHALSELRHTHKKI
jgi:hypothetical protein